MTDARKGGINLFIFDKKKEINLIRFPQFIGNWKDISVYTNKTEIDDFN